MGVYQEMYNDVTTQECKQVPRKNCQDIVDQVCSTYHVDSFKSVPKQVYKDVSVDQQVSGMIGKEECKVDESL